MSTSTGTTTTTTTTHFEEECHQNRWYWSFDEERLANARRRRWNDFGETMKEENNKTSFSLHYSVRTHINEADKVSKDDLKALSSDEAHLRDVFFMSIWMMIGF